MAVQSGEIWRTRAHPLEQVAGPRLLRLLRDAAAQQEVEAARIAAAMYDAMTVEIPAYGAIKDPALAADVRLVSAAVVRVWLQMIRLSRLTTDDMAPFREGARRRAMQGIDLQSLLKAYRVAIRVMWREVLALPGWQHPRMGPVLAVLAEWALDFADALSTAVSEAYLDELARANRETERRRSTLLELVLAGRLDPAQTEVPVELRHAHVVVVGQADDDLPIDRLDRLGVALERAVHASLWTVRPRGVVAVVPRAMSEARVDLVERLRQLVAGDRSIAALGVGGDARGLDQTGSSYLEATEALRIGNFLHERRAVHDFAEIGLLALALRDPAASGRWADGVLAAAGSISDRKWATATVASYVANHGHLKQMGRDLGVHENTVKYRLGVLRDTTGGQLADGASAAELLAALRVRQLLAG